MKSFQLEKNLVEAIEAQILCAERAGSAAKLDAEEGESVHDGTLKRIHDCKMAILEKASADAEAARRARASRQVISRPSSSLSVAQDLLDLDQVRASQALPAQAKMPHKQAKSSSSSDEDDEFDIGSGSADEESPVSTDGIAVEGALGIFTYRNWCSQDDHRPDRSNPAVTRHSLCRCFWESVDTGGAFTCYCRRNAPFVV